MAVPNTFVSSLLRVVPIQSPCVHILGGRNSAASSPPLLLLALALQVQWSTVHQPNAQDLSIFGKGEYSKASPASTFEPSYFDS